LYDVIRKGFVSFAKRVVRRFTERPTLLQAEKPTF
jgi:hypothetical protein